MVDDKNDYFIGIDIGGTNIKYLLRNNDDVLESGSYKTMSIRNLEDMLSCFFSVIDSSVLKCRKENIKGIGIGSKGKVSSDGIIECGTFLPFEKIDLVNILQNKYGIKTRVINDASLPFYVIDENNIDKTILIATLGTNLGTSLYRNDEKVGDENFSSEFAFTGFRNGLNRDYTSTEFLLTMAKENGLNVETPLELFNLAIDNNDVAKEAFEEFGKNIGEVISTLVNKHSIDKIYMSGGITKAEQFFLRDVLDSLNKYSCGKVPSIKIIESEYEIGAYGASRIFQRN